jgi:pilin isopeptide linkage protein
MKDKYSGFKVTFLRDVAASKDSPVTISYVMKFHNEVLEEDDPQITGYWLKTPFVSNYFNVYYPSGDDLTAALDESKGADYCWSSDLPYNVPLTKSNGTYNKEEGTITWTLEVNNRSTLGGSATLYELLPEGLTFESATITAMGALAGDNSKRKATTMNGKGLNEAVTASDCTVEDYTENGQKYSRVTLNFKNLSKFEVISGGQLKTDTLSPVTGAGHNGYAYGRVTVQIKAKVNADVLMSDQAATFVNKAILTDNDDLPGSVTATGSASVPASGSTILSKSKANVDAPAYVQFTLNINTNALDLVDGDGSVVVDDVMGEGMSMATAHKDSFKVYNVTGKDIADDAGKLSVTKVVANGTDVTDQCSWTNVTTEATQPSYQFTVPDSMHVVIVYWAAFSGIAGQQVDVTNSAYYSYNGKDYSNNNSSWSGSVNVQGAGADAYANPYFYLQKQDQWGNNVSGAVFAVFKYNSASGEYDTLVSERTTLNGLAYIGHNVTDSSDSFAKLQMNTIYKIKEISSPVGYKLDNTEHYFEFVDLSNGGTVTVTDEVIAAHVAEKHGGLTVVDMTPGGTYTVTNTFTGASYQIPVKKTINRESIHSTVDFTFNLTQVAADDGSMLPVYTDEDYKVAMPSSGIKATITGSGTTDFTTLHFKSAGTYAFTMTENDLSKDASDRGYSKDTSTYKVVVVVSESNNALSVTSVTYTSDSTEYAKGDILENGDVPTFDNTLSLVGSLNLQVKKVVSGRATEVKADEFSFTVTDNSTGQTIKDSDGNDLVFKTQEGGLVDITIPLSHKDIGTKRYIIREVVPADADKDTSIGYTASPVIAKVTIGEITAAESPNGQAGVAATSKVTYTADKKEDGVPLMVNEYHATGSLKLEGTKKLMYGSEKQAIKAGRFNFVVMEGNTQVATGTTNGEWEDNIDFTEIHYVAADIGTHTYTISEVDEGEMFVEYTDKTVTVTVEVKDAGGGELTVVPTYGGTVDEKDYRQHALFVNTCTFIIPTGIRLDVLPYVLIVLLALGCGALVLRRRKHMRG